eukprot:GFYU01000245.1.p1 GENE.GFYU01000245.1~~GFYU01000245.1.p1  ORF type:complete len:517 (-),score=85.41 GFYU01000245.1:140-1690(-)
MSYSVSLHVYDISMGMARQMSMGILGKQVDAIYHTGINVYGYEYFWSGGIECAPTGKAIPHMQYQSIPLGHTSRTQAEFHDWLRSVGDHYTVNTYHLLDNNCNNFTDNASKFLLGQPIPGYITGLPQEVLSTPMGQMFRPMLEQFMGQMNMNPIQGTGNILNLPPPTARPDGPATAAAPLSAGVTSSQTAGATTTATHGPGAAPTSASVNEAVHRTAAADSAVDALPGAIVGHRHAGLALTTLKKRAGYLLSADRNVQTVMDKLTQVGDVGGLLTDNDKTLMAEMQAALTQGRGVFPQDAAKLINKFWFDFPTTSRFMTLNLLRIALLDEEPHRMLTAPLASPNATTNKDDVDTRSTILDVISKINDGVSSTNVNAVAIMALGNLFARSGNAAWFATSKHVSTIVDKTIGFLQPDTNVVLRQSVASLYYNIAIAIPKQGEMSDWVVQLVCGLFTALDTESVPEAAKRMCAALGHVLFCNDNACELATNLGFSLSVGARISDPEIQSLATEVTSLLV